MAHLSILLIIYVGIMIKYEHKFQRLNQFYLVKEVMLECTCDRIQDPIFIFVIALSVFLSILL